MNILFAASEAHPLIKTGGLGDVAGSLPQELKRLRHDVRLIIPGYRQVMACAGQLTVVRELSLAGVNTPVRLLQGFLPGSKAVLYIIDSPSHFDRPGGPYADIEGKDWPDNATRFAVFCRAVTEIAQGRAGIDWRPQLVHCHDWQTGLIPALLAQEPQRPSTVFTIHNLAYQGLFDWDTFASLSLPQSFWNMDAMEFYGQFSFMKGGLVYADWLTTVSPTYAREILTPEFGCGLEGLLRTRAQHLVGILNGANYGIWSPNKDPHIDQPYNARSLDGKALNKDSLQRACGLPVQRDVPLIGHISRLVEQKGIDLLLATLPALFQNKVQLVVLGNGEKEYETDLQRAAKVHAGRMSVHIGYNEELAHRIEAGSDMFLMPSRFEPCGLNQIYSLRYGTVPVVRRTGGLADTVVDATTPALEQGDATGFVFGPPAADALQSSVHRALSLYQEPRQWRKLVQAGMRQDFSWKRSAAHYQDLYQQAVV